MRTMPCLLLTSLLMINAPALADPPAGQIDPGFGDSDAGIPGLQLEGFNPGPNWHDAASAIVEDAQGRLLVAGVGEAATGPCLGLMRFTANGQLDTNGFGYNANQTPKGKICHPILTPGDAIGMHLDIALLPDGGFLVGGSSDVNPFVCRFHADGRKVDGFGTEGCTLVSQLHVPDALPSSSLAAVLLQDTSILLVSSHYENNGYSPALARLALADGSLDPFGQQDILPLLSSTSEALVFDAVLSGDGDLILAGSIEVDMGDRDAFVARFDLQSLQPDLQFSGDGMARFKFNQTSSGEDVMSAIALLPGGDVLAGGMIMLGPSRFGITVTHLDAASGALDPAFNTGSPQVFDPCPTPPGGCIVLVDSIASTGKHLVISGLAEAEAETFTMPFASRLDLSGNLDTEFGQDGVSRINVGSDFVGTGMVLQDERIVLASSTDILGDFDYALLRLGDGRLFKDQFESPGP